MKLTVQSVKGLRYTLEGKHSKKGTFFPRQVYWDDSLPGFGVRVFPSGKASYVHKYRNAQGQQRFNTIGSVNKIPLEEARKKARKEAVRVGDGSDPLEEKNQARKGQLMSDLCTVYIERHAKEHKKSWVEDERRNRLYIVPFFGAKQIQQVKRVDVADLHYLIGSKNKKPYMANRVREQLSKMFELAKTWAFVDESFINPAKGIQDFVERERNDYVKPEDMPVLAAAIESEPNEVARCVIWLYLLTGKRKTELLEVKWSGVDNKNRTLLIEDTKNGEVEYLSLSEQAWAILQQAKHFRVVGNPHIFPGTGATGHFVNVRKCWERIKEKAVKQGAISVAKVPIHGLRHTFAVWMVSMGEADLGLIRRLLNQKSLLATKVYAKHLQPTLKAAAERHGKIVAELSKSQAAVVRPMKKKTKSKRSK
jgi:integrase